MEFWNFIRNIFGGRDIGISQDKRSSYLSENYDRDMFDSSIWHNDDDDIDIDSRYFKRNNHFHIFSDPLEMTQYFESQMDNMLKTFIFGFHRGADTNALPYSSPNKEDLRDKVLKPNGDQMLTKLDSDLDGKITAENFSNIWDDQSKPKVEMTQRPIIGKFVRKEYVRKSDGTVEEKQVIRDHEGNEETIISQRIGNKIHTIITKKNKDGIESKTEDFHNISESNEEKLLPFNKKNDFYDIQLNFFPWEKFFKPDPKL